MIIDKAEAYFVEYESEYYVRFGDAQEFYWWQLYGSTYEPVFDDQVLEETFRKEHHEGN